MPEIDWGTIRYVAAVQCHIVKERCPGFFCERSFRERTGGFAQLPANPEIRFLPFTCGGCCGRALHRKLALLCRKAAKYDQLEKSQILVTFASCLTRDNYHGPECPHLEYLVTLVKKLGLPYSFDTHLSKRAEARRAEGIYRQPGRPA